MYGTQALPDQKCGCPTFENDVNMYGTQAQYPGFRPTNRFENDVNMYGTQAGIARKIPC